MNDAHLHLIFNHTPVVGMMFLFLLLLCAWISRSTVLEKTCFIGALLIGLLTIPTYLTGDGAVNVVVYLPSVSNEMIGHHADAADKTIYFVGASCVIAVIGCWFSFRQQALPTVLIPLFTLFVAISTVMLGWTAYLGGEIHHPEARETFDAPSSDIPYIDKTQPIYKEP